MKDRNGIEIKTGNVVEISNAFFKSDNGLYLVCFSPNDPGWSGNDYSLVKITRKGVVSKQKYRHASWPLNSYCNDRSKRASADTHNFLHAKIEVKTDFGHKEEIAAYFNNELAELNQRVEFEERFYGKDNVYAKLYDRLEFIKGVTAQLETMRGAA